MSRHPVPPAAVLAVYALAVLAGATLVFLVEPLAARLVLPRFGGSPAVWTTSMLFFQVALLVGYGWAHASTNLLGRRTQAIAQLVLLLVPLAVLPIALPAWAAPSAGQEPAAWLLIVLAVMAGLPFVAVSTAGPVLGRWFSTTNHPGAPDPYFLYAMGNAGSLAGLLAYPFLIEPHLALRDQALLWAAGYVVFVALAAGAALLARLDRAPRSAGEITTTAIEPKADETRPTGRRRVGWIAMAFVPSSLMLGVTTYISSDLAAVPLLWVLPLSLYLVTFIVAFSARSPLTPRGLAMTLPVIVAALALTLVGAVRPPLVVEIGLNLAAFFVAALLAHTRLAGDRPSARHLTEFYLLLAVGGALGGVFNAVVAPLVFTQVLEYPAAIALALLLRPGRPALGAVAERRGRLADVAIALVVILGTLVLLVVISRAAADAKPLLAATLGALAVASLVLVRRPVRFGLVMGGLVLLPLLIGQPALLAERGFFGVNRVEDQGGIRLLIHGTTTHGAQFTDLARAGEPLTYYHRTGPFGRTLDAYLAAHAGPVRIGVIGLGTGAIAAYGRPGDSLTFFEIDPAVIRIASDPALFTYLSNSRATVRLVQGDGRLTLAAEADASFDVLVLDAFNGDAPPAHLLTVEAVDLYASKLAPDGILLVNASNRFIDVPAVIEAGLAARGLPVVVPVDPAAGSPPAPEKEISAWVASARDPAVLAAVTAGLPTAPPQPASHPWTDDFSDLFSVVRWDR
jgi:SAM-dependent methyltransferase